MELNDQPVFTLTVDQLKEIMTAVVKDELAKAFKNRQEPDDYEHDESVMTISDLANFLGCTKSTIHLHRKKGWLPAPFQIGRKVVWKKSDIMKALKTPLGKRKKDS